MRIVVLGYIVRGPLGGMCWHHFQYVLGLKKLGHEILFLEDSDNYSSCYNPQTLEMSKDPDYGLEFIKKLFNRFNVGDSWAYFDAHTNNWYGMNKQKVLSFCNQADIVFNLSAINPLRDWLKTIPSLVFIDTDPLFTQVKIINDLNLKTLANEHNAFFSFGENINSSNCAIPVNGFNWKATRQPIFLDAWKFSTPLPKAKWTTIMQWDSYKTQEYNGISYGMKSISFDDYMTLPEKSNDSFELVMVSTKAPEALLLKSGWGLRNPGEVSLTPEDYQNYIQHSKGEWSVAKQGYVISNSGWFSERSCAYLASGRPVIIQDTGFSKYINTGKGLFSFSTLEEATEAIEIVNSDYLNHCRYARETVKEFFNSDKILTELLNNL